MINAKIPNDAKDPRQPICSRQYTATNGPNVIASPAEDNRIDCAKVRCSTGKFAVTAFAQEVG